MASIHITAVAAWIGLLLLMAIGCPPDTSDGVTHDASSQSLTSVPTNVPDGTQTLQISGNNISSFQASDFSNVSDICNLNMTNNQIYTLPDRGFELLGQLRKLDLNDNNLTQISNSMFDGLNNLQELQLRRNSLVDIAYAFESLLNLMRLYLDENDLQGECQYNISRCCQRWAEVVVVVVVIS